VSSRTVGYMYGVLCERHRDAIALMGPTLSPRHHRALEVFMANHPSTQCLLTLCTTEVRQRLEGEDDA
jgi:hypothetical protein